jgi:hypothetical protein
MGLTSARWDVFVTDAGIYRKIGSLKVFNQMNKNERFLASQSPVRTGFDAVCNGFITVSKALEPILICFDGCPMTNFNPDGRRDFASSDAKPAALKINATGFLLKSKNEGITTFRHCDLCENLCALCG